VLVLALYNSAHASSAIRYRYARSGRVSHKMQMESAGVMRGGVVVVVVVECSRSRRVIDMIREQSNSEVEPVTRGVCQVEMQEDDGCERPRAV
jgi:hypothetical protein